LLQIERNRIQGNNEFSFGREWYCNVWLIEKPNKPTLISSLRIAQTLTSKSNIYISFMEELNNNLNKGKPYFSNWDYIDDQVKRVFLIKRRQNLLNRRFSLISDHKTKKDLEITIGELEQITEKIEHRLFLTVDKGISEPFIEDYIRNHKLNNFECFILFYGIASILYPEFIEEYETQNVKNFIISYTDNIEARIKCRRAFYKDAILVDLGLVHVEPYWGELDDASLIFQTSTLLELLEFPNEKDKIQKGTNRYRPEIMFEESIQPKQIKDNLLCVVKGYLNILKSGKEEDALTIGITGLPGVGKNHLIDGINNKINKDIYYLNFSSLGEHGSYILRSLAQTARNNNGVLFFDDAEAIFQGRDPQILTEIERLKNIIIFLSTNNPKVINPEMQQRFSFHLKIDLPTQENRKKLWQYLKPNEANWGKCVNLDELSERFINISGRTIKNALKIAYYRSSDRDPIKEILTLRDIEEGLQCQASDSYVDLWKGRYVDGWVSPFYSDKIDSEFDEIIHILRQSKDFESTLFSNLTILLHGKDDSELHLAVHHIAHESGKTVHHILDGGDFRHETPEVTSPIKRSLNATTFNPDEILLIEKADSIIPENALPFDTHRNLLVQKIRRFKGAVILTSCYPENIDQRMLRQLNYCIEIKPPDEYERKQIWVSGLHNTEHDLTEEDIQSLAEINDCSTQDIDRAIKRALIMAQLRDMQDPVITKTDIEKAVELQAKHNWIKDGIGY